MKTNPVIGMIFAAVALLMVAPLAGAQQNAPAQPAAQPQQAKKAPQTKVWTDDDMDSLRTPADIYLEQQREAEAKAAAAAQAAAVKPAAPAGPVNHAPAALSNPKTVDSADKMIAWEDRDISAQQEYVQRLKQQLETAPADQQAHIEDLIKQRTQVVADTIKERDGLEAQKEKLQQQDASKTAVGSSSSQQTQ